MYIIFACSQRGDFLVGLHSPVLQCKVMYDMFDHFRWWVKAWQSSVIQSTSGWDRLRLNHPHLNK